jgi:hypothetical protein
MPLILLGALLFLGGVLYIVLQPLKGRLSRFRRLGRAGQGATLEPESPGRGFDIRSNLLGIAMVVVGGILLLAGAMI